MRTGKHESNSFFISEQLCWNVFQWQFFSPAESEVKVSKNHQVVEEFYIQQHTCVHCCLKNHDVKATTCSQILPSDACFTLTWFFSQQ